ncbi:unconventional myosin-XV-like protein, partial [Lates japonicus]
MPKKDAKKDAKKGGKPEPEKKKEEEKKGKDDKKGGKDDKKAGKDDKKGGKDDKKGGKDDKKGGKKEPPKGKDDGKKGKDKGKGKKVESEEEEEELLSDEEEEEEFSEEEDEEEEDSEDDRRGKGRGGKGAKGKKGGRSRRGEDSEDEEEDEDEEEEDDEDEDYGKSKKKSKDHHKGGKSDADGKKKKHKKKEDAPPLPIKEIPKKGLKNMSRMFMKFSGFKRRRNSRKKLKSTSRLFLGLGKRKNRLAKKKRRKSMLKNTSRFMMRFKASKKRKKEKEAKEKAAANGGKKPTYMLLRLGGGKEEKKGGFFKGLFGKKNGDGPADDFKNRSLLLGKVAAATNWLTKRFLSTKMRGNSGQHGWGGRRGHSRQASSRGYLHGYHNDGYEQGEDPYGYDQRHSSRQKGYGGYDDGYGGYVDEAAAAYGDQGQFGYYDNGAGGADYQDLGYYEEEGLYDPNAEYYEGGVYDEGMGDYYNPYSSAQGYYNNQEADYYGYQQQQAAAMYGDEGLDYYALMGEDHIYAGEVDGFLDPQAQGYYDENGQVVYYADGQGGYYDDGQAGYYENPYAATMGMQGGFPPDYQLSYSDAGMQYQDYSSQQAVGFPQGGQQVLSFGGQGIDQVQGLYGEQFADQMDQYGGDTGGLQGGDMTFRVPRPQVRLFGKERLDVPMPPPPTLPPDPEFEDMSEIQYEDQIPLAPASRHVPPSCASYATFSDSIPPLCHDALTTDATPSLCHGFPSPVSYASTETKPLPATIHEGRVHWCPKTPLCYVETHLTSFLPHGVPPHPAQNATSEITVSSSPRALTPPLSPCFHDTAKSSTVTKSINEAALSTFLAPRFHEEAKSPTVSHSCSQPVWREEDGVTFPSPPPCLSPAGPRPAPLSPTLSRRSTRLLRDPTPLARPRMGGNVPLGTVRPSPMGLRGRPVPPPTQNVRPFRTASIRSNRSSVLTVDSSLHSSPFHSPHMIHRAPLGRRESGRFPPRPIARGRPLMAQQSMRRMPPASPQPSLKHMPHPASPRLSPRLSRQSSPHLPPRIAHPPVYAPETYVSGPHADPYIEQIVAPSSPMLSGALQNQAIRQASFSSPLGPQVVGVSEMAPEYIEPYIPSSPTLSGAMQNQAIRDASYVPSLQRPMSPYEQPMPPSSPMLSGALQNQAVREASYVSPLQRPQSPYAQSVPSSPMLSGAMRHGQALRGVASYQTPQLRSPYGPTVVTPYDYISEPGPAPLLHDALQNRAGLQNVSSLRSPMMQRRNPYAPAGPQLHSALQQNPNLRQASYQTPMQLRRPSYGPPPPSSPRLGSALQNPQVMQASYRLPDGTLVSPYATSRSSPVLGHALQNQQVRGASYTLPDGSVIRDPRVPQKPMSPNLSRALQNQDLKSASYTLPDGTIIDPRQQQPISPNLAKALTNPALRAASYSLPDGTIVIDPNKQKSPNLAAALQNPYLKSASYTLPDGTIIIDPRKPVSPNLSNALQNTALRGASFTLPEGVQDPNTPISPNQAKALSNPALKGASYTLPDGTIIVDPRKQKSPTLTAALQNPYLKGVSYTLPDGTIIIDPRKPVTPDLSKALLNENLRKASYHLPDGSLVIPGQKPNLAGALRQNKALRSTGLYHLSDGSVLSGVPKPTTPNLSSALKNEELRGVSFRLPDGSVLTRRFHNPSLSDAIQNQQLRYASYRVPTGLQGEDNRYAVVPPYGPRSGHWARNAQGGGGEGGEDVWAAERVLPHGTVQNLSKWSMYREDGVLEGYSPTPRFVDGQLKDPDWTPDRDRAPGQSWYDKIFSILSTPITGHRAKNWAEGMEDMTQLPELNETTVLMNLKKRYDQELIYTYIGSILVSVNPYKLLNMYGTDMVLQYEGRSLSDNPPHLFAIANLSYTTMMDAKKDQCIVISGESGSGKTEATKLILRYLTAIHHKRNVTQQ